MWKALLRSVVHTGRLAEAGIEGAAEGVVEAEAELSVELRTSPAHS